MLLIVYYYAHKHIPHKHININYPTMSLVCLVCQVPSAVLFRCDHCPFIGCPYIEPGQCLSHV